MVHQGDGIRQHAEVFDGAIHFAQEEHLSYSKAIPLDFYPKILIDLF
jgi:hypothetical protein